MLINAKDIVVFGDGKSVDVHRVASLAEKFSLYGVDRDLRVFAREDGKYLLCGDNAPFRAAVLAGFTHLPCDVLNPYPPPPKVQKRERRGVIRDGRLLVNTLKRAVEQVRAGGMRVGFEQEELPDATLIRISLPK